MSNSSAVNFTMSRFTNVRTKIVAAITAMTLVGLLILGYINYYNYKNQLRESTRQRLLDMVSIAALQQNSKLHTQIRQAGDEELAAYKLIKSNNSAIVQTDPDIEYVYTMRLNNLGQIYFVVDTGRPGDEDTAPVGKIYDDASDLLNESFATLDHPIVESEFYTDEWGTFLSAYAPFYDEEGQREGVVGLDISASKVVEKEKEVLNSIAQSTGLVMIFVILIGFILGNSLSRPIINLSTTAQNILDGDLNARAELTTNDEVGILADTFNKMTSRLQDSMQNLEKLVDSRTEELVARNKQLDVFNSQIQRRAEQLEALAQVAQSIASIRDLNDLLTKVTQLISEHYSFYHVGLFLIDDANEYAVLTAANSEGGQRMLQRQHRLKIGEQGIVGAATGSGQPRIALDVGADAVYFNNPDLPDTHSEMTLPILIGEKVIGALDVQSTESGAFTPEDVQTLGFLATQVGLAIENTRLFEASRRTLGELQMLMKQSTRKSWERIADSQTLIGYRYDSKGALPLNEPVDVDGQIPVVVPIELRGESIGKILIRSVDGRDLNDDEIELIRAAAERVAFAAENARLFEETVQRAERERTVSDITSKIRSHTDPKSMIETALSELKNALNVSRVEIVKKPVNGRKDAKE